MDRIMFKMGFVFVQHFEGPSWEAGREVMRLFHSLAEVTLTWMRELAVEIRAVC
jgi:hypothetical protein